MEYERVFKDYDFEVSGRIIGTGSYSNGNLVFPTSRTSLCKPKEDLYRVRWLSVIYARKKDEQEIRPHFVYFRRCHSGKIVPHIIPVQEAINQDGKCWFKDEREYMNKQTLGKIMNKTFACSMCEDFVTVLDVKGEEVKQNVKVDGSFVELLAGVCPTLKHKGFGYAPGNDGFVWNPVTQEIEKRGLSIKFLRFDFVGDQANLAWQIKADVEPLPSGAFADPAELDARIDTRKDLRIVEL